jgi:hypothetical protein
MDARGEIFYGAPIIDARDYPVSLDYPEREKIEKNKLLEVYKCGGEGDSFAAIGIKETEFWFDWENFRELHVHHLQVSSLEAKRYKEIIEEAAEKIGYKAAVVGWYVGCRISA